MLTDLHYHPVGGALAAGTLGTLHYKITIMTGHVLPHDGNIVAWDVYSSITKNIYLEIWRATETPLIYQLIHKVLRVVVVGKNHIVLDNVDKTAVKAGDVLATQSNTYAMLHTLDPDCTVGDTFTFATSTGLNVGSSLTFVDINECRRYPMQAEIVGAGKPFFNMLIVSIGEEMITVV